MPQQQQFWQEDPPCQQRWQTLALTLAWFLEQLSSHIFPLCIEQNFIFLFPQKSSSSESLSDKGSAELKKSFDAVVFDVLKVTPEEYAVSNSQMFF